MFIYCAWTVTQFESEVSSVQGHDVMESAQQTWTGNCNCWNADSAYHTNQHQNLLNIFLQFPIYIFLPMRTSILPAHFLIVLIMSSLRWAINSLSIFASVRHSESFLARLPLAFSALSLSKATMWKTMAVRTKDEEVFVVEGEGVTAFDWAAGLGAGFDWGTSNFCCTGSVINNEQRKQL